MVNDGSKAASSIVEAGNEAIEVAVWATTDGRPVLDVPFF
jgi:hypothetical protein